MLFCTKNLILDHFCFVFFINRKKIYKRVTCTTDLTFMKCTIVNFGLITTCEEIYEDVSMVLHELS